MKNITIHKNCEKCKKKNVCKFVNIDPTLLLYNDTDILDILTVEFTCTEYEEYLSESVSITNILKDENKYLNMEGKTIQKITKEMVPYRFENNIIYSNNGLSFYWADGRPVSRNIIDKILKSSDGLFPYSTLKPGEWDKYDL